jgi:hypothetical protein
MTTVKFKDDHDENNPFPKDRYKNRVVNIYVVGENVGTGVAHLE